MDVLPKKPNKPLSRQPSLRNNKKPPEIKHTLTSKYRLLKANPLLGLSKDRLNKLGIDTEKYEDKLSNGGPPHFLDHTSASLIQEKPKFNLSAKLELKTTTQRPKKTVGNNGKSSNNYHSDLNIPKINLSTIKKTRDETTKKIDFVKRNIETLASIQKSQKTANTVNLKRSNSTKLPKTKNPSKAEASSAPLRRSLSSQHIERKKGNTEVNPQSCYLFKNYTKSFEDLRAPQTNNLLQLPQVSPIIEEITFKTPSAYQRRSAVFKTPNTINSMSNRRSLFVAGKTSTPAAPFDLEKRLNDWLKKRGKSQSSFHHLKCFGIHENKSRKIVYSPEEEENKENVEVDIPDDDSFKSLAIEHSDEDLFEINAENNERVAKGALGDLLKLIREGYSREQCECWLGLVRHKYNALEEEPEYWECRAAIEQSRGNITSAVECYKTAIVHGAEIKSVDKALDQLLQKFSLLNISTHQDEEPDSKDRVRIVQDARNVFKSSIIQFAVQERKNKNEVKKLIATPVRRSTRISRSKYTTTPGVTLYSSLQDINSSTRSNIDFRQNSALLH